MKLYSTVKAAELLGVGRDTLYRWIRDGKIAGPKFTKEGDFQPVVWTDSDIARFQRFIKKNYQKSKARKSK